MYERMIEFMYACMYVCMYVCMCMYVCVCMYVYVCMYIFINAWYCALLHTLFSLFTTHAVFLWYRGILNMFDMRFGISILSIQDTQRPCATSLALMHTQPDSLTLVLISFTGMEPGDIME